MTSGKPDFNIFKFKYGRKKKNIKHYAKLALLINLPLDLISLIPGVQKKKVFNTFDKLVQKFNIDTLNDFIIKDEELVSYRIERVINEALKNIEDKNV